MASTRSRPVKSFRKRATAMSASRSGVSQQKSRDMAVGLERFSRLEGAIRAALDASLPAPQAESGEKVRERHSVRYHHHLPGRILEELGQADDQALARRETQAMGRMAIRHIL